MKPHHWLHGWSVACFHVAGETVFSTPGWTYHSSSVGICHKMTIAVRSPYSKVNHYTRLDMSKQLQRSKIICWTEKGTHTLLSRVSGELWSTYCKYLWTFVGEGWILIGQDVDRLTHCLIDWLIDFVFNTEMSYTNWLVDWLIGFNIVFHTGINSQSYMTNTPSTNS